MLFTEFVSKEILNFTDDEKLQLMFMYHRYLLCSYAVCRYILNNEENNNIRDMVQPYKDNLRVAVVYMEDHLENSCSDTIKEKAGMKQVFEESWSYARKELENYVESNYITKKGIAEKLKIAHYYAYEILKIIIKSEDDFDAKNLTNLKN